MADDDDIVDIDVSIVVPIGFSDCLRYLGILGVCLNEKLKDSRPGRSQNTSYLAQVHHERPIPQVLSQSLDQ